MLLQILQRPLEEVVEVKILDFQEKVCTASPVVSPVPFETPLNTWESPMPAIYTELPPYTFPTSACYRSGSSECFSKRQTISWGLLRSFGWLVHQSLTACPNTTVTLSSCSEVVWISYISCFISIEDTVDIQNSINAKSCTFSQEVFQEGSLGPLESHLIPSSRVRVETSV